LNVISKTGLLHLMKNKSKEALDWYWVARRSDWSSFAAVRESFLDADLVNGLFVFNIRQNRYCLIVYPVFSRRKLYIKALLTHSEYTRGDWSKKWP
jgi:mRNA interferase HigB